MTPAPPSPLRLATAEARTWLQGQGFHGLELVQRDDIVQSLAALLTARDAAITQAVVEWRPIETAPKNEIPVDLWFPDFQDEPAHRRPTCVWNRGYDCWQAAIGNVRMDMIRRHRKPTHWMPLPSAPKLGVP